MTARVPLQRLRWHAALWFAARTMPIRVRGRELAPLIAAHEPGDARSMVGLSADEILDAVRNVTRHPWAMRDRRCLRQGLLAYRYLKLAGCRPEIHFGVDRRSIVEPRISAHCWIVLEGKAVLNPPDDAMVTIFVYDGPKRLSESGVPALKAIDRSTA